MAIELAEPPRRFMDDGHPVEELHLEHSRYDRIAVKRTDDGLVIRTREHDGSEDTYEMQMVEQLFKGVTPQDQKRRDFDDDLLDALFVTGHAVIDESPA